MVQTGRATTIEEAQARISLRELERAVTAADHSAILVAPRLLRRVIKQNGLLPGFGFRAPHRKSYVLSRAALLSIVDTDELDLPVDAELAETVIMLARPTAERLEANSATDNLTTCWRLLFHARVHLALDREIAAGRLGHDDMRERIKRIGATEFAEVRQVLAQEDFLLPPTSDRATYVEFAAVFLELKYFAPSFLNSYFPGLADRQQIHDLLAEDVDAENLFQATRPAGAPDKPERRDVQADEPSKAVVEPPPVQRRVSLRAFGRLLDRAARVGIRGNLVRAAILRISAAERGTPELSRAARSEARADMDRLAERLQAALGFPDDECEEWGRVLALLSALAARGFWTAEARLLYDLQKVCIDHERGVYTLDAYRWLRSGFRVPLKRPLPGQRSVLFSKHLHSAARRLPVVRLSGRIRARLAALLQSAARRAEEYLRMRFRPAIGAALDRVKLRPQNLPERVAREKLIDELLDRIVERGFLTMGDLRDALSRNNLKMPDVTSIRQLLFGDQLLETNRQLADSLDGVYHRGEIYLSFPQRLSSLAFGTPLGRFLTQYVVLPFGGAFLIQKGVQHVIAPHAEQSAFDPWSLAALVYTGLFVLGLLHVHRFRMMCLDVLWSAGRAGRAVLVDLPKQVLDLPVVQSIVHSLYFRLLQRGLFKPLLVSALIVPLAAYIFDFKITISNCVAIFLAVNLVLNTRVGRNVDELVTDWVAHAWYRFRIRVLATLFRFIMDIFSRLLENLERMLYTVDEWLRFRTGERPLAVIAKAVLGLVWFFVNYFIRFCVNLLIEPQINPIKHFPVVTVSHKILIPLTVPFIHFLQGPLGNVWADTIAPTIVLLLPGVFGFLVWELKENWRLYAANRPSNIGPVTIGHHGEVMLQFIKPGFRSGTIPKLFAKLRRANRKAYWTGQWRTVSKHLAGLHRAEEELRRFVDRELLTLLKHSRGWQAQPVASGNIGLETNRILVEVCCPELSATSVVLAFYEQDGWLVATTQQRGWLNALDAQQRAALENALAGFFKMAGVDLVLEQLDAQLSPLRLAYSIDEQGLKTWPLRSPRDITQYAMREWPPADNEPVLGDVLSTLPKIDARALILARMPLAWDSWVETWEADQHQGAEIAADLDRSSVLPSRQIRANGREIDSSEASPPRVS